MQEFTVINLSKFYSQLLKPYVQNMRENLIQMMTKITAEKNV